MDLSLQDRTALVTGAASGIGAATAAVLAAEGARVVLADRDKGKLSIVAGGLPGPAGGGRHIEVAADLSSAEGVAAAMRETLAATGGVVDILVSNAGQCSWRTLDELDDRAWLDTFESNFLAAVRIARILLPGMLQRRTGSIVLTSSDLARQPEASPADYQVSKAALLSLMKSLALTAAPHVRVNAVAPGPVWTPLWSRPGGIADRLADLYGLPQEEAVQRELSLRQLPLGRIGQPCEIARVIAFLASEAASFVTGSVWGADGGSIRGLL
jgi:NAD(P)-dependent dehydrogenase (short-subunit alcohol dehydrogenase family)